MDPLPLRDRDPVRFRLESIRTHLLKRLVRTYDRGLSGQISKDEAPGYGVGVKAAIALLERTDPAPKSGDGERPPIAINLAIVSSEARGVGHTPEGDGVAIRFSGGYGDSP